MPSILITGASSGIGRALANLYAERGWHVVGTATRPDTRPDGLNRLVELERLDLSVPGAAAELASRVVARFGCPDVLVNNAGTLHFGPLEEVAQDDLAHIFQVNVFGQMELIRALVPQMRERGSGVIANVTSLGGTLTFPFFGAYNSTKWALEGMSEGLWHELRSFGIRVKAIEPGFVETQIWGKALPAADVRDDQLRVGAPYVPAVRAMLAFERSIKDRTSPEAAAVEIAAAIDDPGERMRYPIAAYARPIIAARRFLGPQATMRFFHDRWVGPRT